MDYSPTKNMKRANTYYYNKKYSKTNNTHHNKYNTYNPKPLYYFKNYYHGQIRAFNRGVLCKSHIDLIELGTIYCNNLEWWDGLFKPSIR
jgi:hypothetical protein